ncbi:SWI/SNF and RSC complexes subunit ssr4 [Metarhizium anisopliae]|nr:SWI/SNF and RSC complexes subunit ssr4 [Metarhizium anisopliae]
MAQPDPSHTVPQDLMPHVHLVSSYRYPTMPRIDMNEVAKWLMTAPQIARDRAPFFWTYLDKPADGTILLAWQPLQRLGTNFATDGFVWAPPEQVYKHDLGNGLILEIYYLKAGYIPGEQFALHTRRRFRLVPTPGHPNPPPLDMSLFIVHYGPSEQNDRVPASMVPYDERVNAIMQQRHFLLRGGQIRRKEFMLSDRVNWPSLPELTRQQMGPQMAPRGQNHEWMEEILSSAYRIGQIQPSDLNLGLKGELASLTEGIFTAQGGDVFTQSPEKPYVGRLDSGLADEFRKRVSKHVESTESEIKKLQEEHAELMASFKQNSALKIKEKQIRSIPDPPVPEIFKAEDRSDNVEEQRAPTLQPGKTPFDAILKDVEASIGRKIDIHPVVKRVQDGGYQAPAPKPPTPIPTTQMSRQPSQSGSQNSGLMMGDSDMEMGGTAAGLLDQMHTGFSSTSTPVNNFPTPQAQVSAAQSNAPTPSNAHNMPSPAPALPTVPEAITDGGSASFDQNDFSSLGDLDTAGDAMAGYDAPDLDGSAGGLGEDLDLQMDMDDSAFGDAFHVDASGTPGDAHNQDL